jgi:hypothetical protein
LQSVFAAPESIKPTMNPAIAKTEAATAPQKRRPLAPTRFNAGTLREHSTSLWVASRDLNLKFKSR